jgi:hypothetical protein
VTVACDVGKGICVTTPVPDGSACSDANQCNGAEVCRGGTCSVGTPLDCNDNDPCTLDLPCDPVRGCIHAEPDQCGLVACTMRDLPPDLPCAAVPPKVQRNLDSARKLVESTCARKKCRIRRILLGQALAHLNAEDVPIGKRITPACANGLKAAFDAKRLRVQQLRCRLCPASRRCSAGAR